MKIIEESKMIDGVEIQLEDWDGELAIGAYPTAQRSSGYWIRGGEMFRLMISANEYRGYLNDDVRADFEALKDGKKALEDLADYFWNGKRDAEILGM